MTRRLTATAALLCLLAAPACASTSTEKPAPQAAAASTWPGCDTFTTQPQAQNHWQANGRPATADRDKDGRVCEDLPVSGDTRTGTDGGSGQSGEAKTTDCVRTRKVVRIGLSKTKYPNVLGHARRAIRKGWPAVMVINRRGAEERRDKLLAGIPTKSGYDRDEYPMAFGRGKGNGLQRGSNPRGWKADVEYVPSSENRSAGSVVGIKLRRYCDTTKFRIIGY